MISMKELNPKNFPTTPEIEKNLEQLLIKVNYIRKLWGKPMTVTSGLRSMEDHLRIYANKGITNLFDVPLKSKHLLGQACDISDPGLELTKWLKDNPEHLMNAGLWCEEGNKNWVHFQSVKPKSGSRWFKP